MTVVIGEASVVILKIKIYCPTTPAFEKIVRSEDQFSTYIGYT